MKSFVPLAVGLTLLFGAEAAHAEYRVVLVVVRHTADGKCRVTIRSDVKAEQQESIAIDKACDIIKDMKGWGSGVGVHVVTDRGLAGLQDKKLMSAILDNAWLSIVSVGREMPKGVPEAWRKEPEKPKPDEKR